MTFRQILILMTVLIGWAAASQAGTRWEEIFDDPAGVPAGWQFIDNDGSGTTIDYVDSLTFDVNGNLLGVSPQAGTFFLHGSWQNANDDGLIDEWIITPLLPDIQEGDSLVFYAGAIDGSWADSLRVLVSPTGNAVSDFSDSQMLAHFRVHGPTGYWHRYAFPLVYADSTTSYDYSGQPIYMAVNYRLSDGGWGGHDSDNIWIDHFALVDSLGASVAIEEEVVTIPDVHLLDNYPNPFQNQTTIAFQLPVATNARIQIYNTAGQLVRTILNRNMPAGHHTVSWDGTNNSGQTVSGGVYFFQLKTGDGFSAGKRLVLLR